MVPLPTPITIILTLLTLTHSQILPTNIFNLSINTINQTTPMVTNGIPNSSFIQVQHTFDCSLSPLFTYNQSQASLKNNAPYYLVLTGLTQPTTIAISTIHQNFNPNSTPSVCFPPSCTVYVTNNCQKQPNFFNYFDRVLLTIQNYPYQLSYYVICSDKFVTNTFQWGMVIQIIAVTIIITIVALYSRAWSLGGHGIQFNIWLIIIFNLIIVIGVIIAAFSDQAINICLQIVTFTLGILGVAICTNQLLFLLRLQPLYYPIFKISTLQFRLLQIISLCIGTGVLIGWWYSSHNMIVNDIVCLCMVVGFIKVLKFTSLKIAGLAFIVTIVLQLIAAFLIYYVTNQSYNSLFLNKYNYPLELQMPTINAVYNQKCAWLPITAIIYPGMLFSYLRRFDASRSTRLYLIIGCVTFFIGGISWMFLSIASPVTLPFGFISEPCMFGLVCVFAYRRRQIRTLWDGQFYDQQFGNRQDLQVALQMVGTQSIRSSAKTIDSKLIQQLKQVNSVRGSGRRSSDSNVVRSKFLKGLQMQNRQ